MSFFIVVHHPQDEVQPRTTSWLDDDRLESIVTTADVAERCAVAKRRGERINIHRKRLMQEVSVICCSAKVRAVTIDGDRSRIEFEDHRVLGTKPPILPTKDQETYGSA